MAQSRINKGVSIFTRLNGLIKSNLVKYEERPLWFDIYKAFPPQRDPLYRSILANDVTPKLPKKLFYKEDELRAFYFKNVSPIETVVLNSNLLKPNWEIFISTFNELESKGIKEENLVDATIEVLQSKGYYFKNNKKKQIEDKTSQTNQNVDQKSNTLSTKESSI